jgi:hypothetical protein
VARSAGLGQPHPSQEAQGQTNTGADDHSIDGGGHLLTGSAWCRLLGADPVRTSEAKKSVTAARRSVCRPGGPAGAAGQSRAGVVPLASGSWIALSVGRVHRDVNDEERARLGVSNLQCPAKLRKQVVYNAHTETGVLEGIESWANAATVVPDGNDQATGRDRAPTSRRTSLPPACLATFSISSVTIRPRATACVEGTMMASELMAQWT